jgi:hypothetical protein
LAGEWPRDGARQIDRIDRLRQVQVKPRKACARVAAEHEAVFVRHGQIGEHHIG